MAGPLLCAERMTAVTKMEVKIKWSKSGSLAKQKIKSSCWIHVNHFRLENRFCFLTCNQQQSFTNKELKGLQVHSSNHLFMLILKRIYKNSKILFCALSMCILDSSNKYIYKKLQIQQIQNLRFVVNISALQSEWGSEVSIPKMPFMLSSGNQNSCSVCSRHRHVFPHLLNSAQSSSERTSVRKTMHDK